MTSRFIGYNNHNFRIKWLDLDNKKNMPLMAKKGFSRINFLVKDDSKKMKNFNSTFRKIIKFSGTYKESLKLNEWLAMEEKAYPSSDE